jgi:hypothetical protein
MYYSYIEIEYIATSFSPARTDLALKLLKSQTMALIAMMRGQPKDGYRRERSNRHYWQTVELRMYNTTTR